MEKHFCTQGGGGLEVRYDQSTPPTDEKVGRISQNSAIFHKRANYNGKGRPCFFIRTCYSSASLRKSVLIAGKISSWKCCLMDCEKPASIQYSKNFFFLLILTLLAWVDKKLIQITFAPAVISMKLESNKSVVLLLSKLNELWKDLRPPMKKY